MANPQSKITETQVKRIEITLTGWSFSAEKSTKIQTAYPGDDIHTCNLVILQEIVISANDATSERNAIKVQ
jgi:hypothetical protein